MNWSARKGHCSGLRLVCLLLGMLSATPIFAATNLIYVANRGGTTINVIDAATNKVVQTIDNIEAPEVIQFSRDGSQLYIFSRTDPEKNFLFVMDRKSDKIVKQVPLSGWARPGSGVFRKSRLRWYSSSAMAVLAPAFTAKVLERSLIVNRLPETGSRDTGPAKGRGIWPSFPDAAS